MTTFVLVHPAWFGGWCWRKVSPVLRARGHEVFAPTLTGLGERAHLASQKVGLEMHVEDVANVLEYEDLRQVILVGNSSGGMVITGVADRMPERIAHLVYLDAFVPEDGQSMLDIIPAERRPLMEALVQKEGSGWLLPRFAPPPWEKFVPEAWRSPTRTTSAGSCLVCGRPRSATSKSRCAGTIPGRKTTAHLRSLSGVAQPIVRPLRGDRSKRSRMAASRTCYFPPPIHHPPIRNSELADRGGGLSYRSTPMTGQVDLLRCMRPFVALFSNRAEQCRLFGVDRPTYAQCEFFAVWTPTGHQADGRAHGAGISEGIQNHSDSEQFRSSPRTCHALGCRLSVRDSRFPALRTGTHHERAGYRGEAEQLVLGYRVGRCLFDPRFSAHASVDAHSSVSCGRWTPGGKRKDAPCLS